MRRLTLLAVTVALLLASAPGAAAQNPRVALETTMGTIVIELYPDEAPETVENFLAYVESGFYSGTIFHRILKGYLIQGGGHTADMTEKPTRDPIQNEADNGLKNKRATVVMARQARPHTATSQFFINTTSIDSLNHKGKNVKDWGYAVFGEVVEGMDVVDAISEVATTNLAGMADVPIEPVMITSAAVLQ